MTPLLSSETPSRSTDFLDSLIADIIQRYQEESSLTSLVQECWDCSHSGNLKQDCPVCGPLQYCDDHFTNHVALSHSDDSPLYSQVRNLKVRQYMQKGIISAFYTPDQVIDLGGEFDNLYRSNWYEEAQHLGLVKPHIITVRPPQTGDTEASRQRAQRTLNRQVNRFMEALNLRAYNWTASKNITLFAAARTGLHYLPQDEHMAEQSASGLLVNRNSKAGKVMKRFRAGTQAEGAWFVPEPSTFPDLKLPGGITHRVMAIDTNTAGDGSGAYRKSSAKEMINASGAAWTDDIIAVQMNFLGADYAGKGMFIVTEDHEFPGDPGYDLVVDTESFNEDVLSTRFTKGKVTPIRHKPNERQVYAEPLILGEVVSRFIDPTELASQALKIARKANRETWQTALDGDNQGIFRQTKSPEWNDSKRPLLNAAISRKAEDKTLIAYTASGSSPFASPQVMDRMSGGTAKHWDSRANRSSPMPGIMLSGESVLFMHTLYAQTPSPGPGYTGLVWHREQPDQLIGVTLNKSDLFKHRDALDTVDADDKLILVFLQDQNGQFLALILRLPLSVDGGVLLKVKKPDARKLLALGYHFYRKTGGHKWPDLYTLAKGEPLYPYRLEAKPFDVFPAWTTRESQALASLLEITRYRNVIGQVTNLSANLDYAGIYDPHEFKFNLSDSIIDPSLNASADPSPVIRPLEQALLKAIRAGRPMDPCVFERVRRRIESLHQEELKKENKPGARQVPDPSELRAALLRGEMAELDEALEQHVIEALIDGRPVDPEKLRPVLEAIMDDQTQQELTVVLKCQDHHQTKRAGMKTAVNHLTGELRARKQLANGPAEWLTSRFGPQLTAIVVEAFGKRAQAWSECSTKRAQIRKDDELNQNEKEARTAQLIEDAKRAEADAIISAYAKAFYNVDRYRRGYFMALWVQLSLGQAKRFKGALQPMSTHCLNVLPPEEHWAYSSAGDTFPTIVIRTLKRVKLEPGTQCRIQSSQGSGAKWRLTTPDGNLIAYLEKEAAEFADQQVEVLGYLPRIESEDPDLYQQAPNLLALRANIPAVPNGDD